MKDIVRHFETLANIMNWEYTYGKVSALNLKLNVPAELDGYGNDITDDKIYFLAEPTTRNYVLTSGANEALNKITYTGAFMVVMKSNIADQYFAEYNADSTNSKYTKHVEPLLKKVPDMISYLVCSGLTLTSFNVVDWIDYTDENRDGIMIRYTIDDEF